MTITGEGLFMTCGTLIVVGTGIVGVAHLTTESIAAIDEADIVFYLVADQLTVRWILDRRADAISLFKHYKEGLNREVTYKSMAEEIMDHVREGKYVTAAFYGHPGVFVDPSHRAIKMAKEEGHYARMLPGIAADSCMIADLGIDPSREGWQAYEATHLVIAEKLIDPSTPLAVWQIGVVGDVTYSPNGFNLSAMDILKRKLLKVYPENHLVCVYEASEYAVIDFSQKWVQLKQLSADHVTALSTLYIPPCKASRVDEECLREVKKRVAP